MTTDYSRGSPLVRLAQPKPLFLPSHNPWGLPEPWSAPSPPDPAQAREQLLARIRAGEASPASRAAEIARREFRSAFAEQQLDPSATEPWRVRCLHRILRALLQAVGLLDQAKPSLLEAIAALGDPFQTPLPPPRGPQALIALWPLLPDSQPTLMPPVASPLHAQLWEITALELDMFRGSPKDPDLGRWGLQGLLDPSKHDTYLPPLEAVIAYEDRLAQDLLHKIANGSIPEARCHLQDWHGFLTEEARLLLVLARRRAVDELPSNIEEASAIMQLRAEGFIARCRDQGQLAIEARGLKFLAQIQGLTRQDPRDEDDDFADMVKADTAFRELEQAPEAEDLDD